MNSHSSELITAYKLVHQYWLIRDPQIRANMINGVGPMKLVKNRMNYSLWPGKRTIKQPDEYNEYTREVNQGAQSDEDGILAFATANQQVLVCNWNTGQ